MKGRTLSGVLLCLALIGTIVIASAQTRSVSFSAPSTQLRQVAYLKASNTEMGDRFGNGGTLEGHGVALSGDGNTLAVGAPYESSGAKGINGDQNDNSVYSAGAVYVYTRRNNAWSQQAYIKASNPGQSDKFGYVVSLSQDGNTLAVSAYYEASAAKGINGDQNDNSIPQAGAVYVFTRTGTTWSQQAYIKASNTGEAGVGDQLGDGDQFGFSIGLSADGNTLAVGAIGEDSGAKGINGDQNDNSQPGSGAVYVFTRTGAAWSQQAYLKASNAENGDSLGYAIAISQDGNTIAGGAADEDCMTPGVFPGAPAVCDNDQPMDNSSGAVYVFIRNGTTWTQQAFIKSSNPGKEDWFGSRLTLSGDGDTLAVGAQVENGSARGINGKPDDAAEDAGAVYLFTRTGSTWAQQAYVKASNAEAYDEFGSAMALSKDGRLMAVGARGEGSAAKGINGNQNDNSALGAGAVYIFT